MVYRGGALDIEARFGQYGHDAFWEGLEKEIVLFLNYYGLRRILVAGRRKEAVMGRLEKRYPMGLPLEGGGGVGERSGDGATREALSDGAPFGGWGGIRGSARGGHPCGWDRGGSVSGTRGPSGPSRHDRAGS